MLRETTRRAEASQDELWRTRVAARVAPFPVTTPGSRDRSSLGVPLDFLGHVIAPHTRRTLAKPAPDSKSRRVVRPSDSSRRSHRPQHPRHPLIVPPRPCQQRLPRSDSTTRGAHCGLRASATGQGAWGTGAPRIHGEQVWADASCGGMVTRETCRRCTRQNRHRLPPLRKRPRDRHPRRAVGKVRAAHVKRPGPSDDR